MQSRGVLFGEHREVDEDAARKLRARVLADETRSSRKMQIASVALPSSRRRARVIGGEAANCSRCEQRFGATEVVGPARARAAAAQERRC